MKDDIYEIGAVTGGPSQYPNGRQRIYFVNEISEAQIPFISLK